MHDGGAGLGELREGVRNASCSGYRVIVAAGHDLSEL